MYERDGRESRVTGWTGLWATLGALIIVGPLVWLVTVQRALNRYGRGRSEQDGEQGETVLATGADAGSVS